jgi:acyl-CoA thioesterase I
MGSFLFVLVLLTTTLAHAESPVTRVVVLGDSLVEGFGVAREKAFPALLEGKLKAQFPKRNWIVVNSGISGSTSASGPARMKWILKQRPDWIVLALGANDGLRGLPPPAMQKNLEETIRLAQTQNVRVILAGMQMPPNYGASYRTQFAAVFPKVAKNTGVPLIPFLLEGVAGVAAMNLADGIHPNEKGHQQIAGLVFQNLKGRL